MLILRGTIQQLKEAKTTVFIFNRIKRGGLLGSLDSSRKTSSLAGARPRGDVLRSVRLSGDA